MKIEPKAVVLGLASATVISLILGMQTWWFSGVALLAYIAYKLGHRK